MNFDNIFHLTQYTKNVISTYNQYLKILIYFTFFVLSLKSVIHRGGENTSSQL